MFSHKIVTNAHTFSILVIVKQETPNQQHATNVIALCYSLSLWLALQAVQNGDAVTVGQAWHDVRAGTLKPEDVDTLNTLLK